MTDNKIERNKVKKAIKDLVKNINETTHIPAITEDDIFELFQLDSVADLRKVSRNFLKLSKILDYFSTVTEIATSEKEGIVKFGIENGNAINAEAWKQAIGQTLGGYVSKVENKEAGKWYINDLTDGKIYKCIQSHRSTSFDITKFIDITNIGLSDKLENLFKVETKRINITNGFVKFTKTGNIVSCFLHLANATQPFTFNNDTQLINYPAEFIPNVEYFHTEHVMMAQERNNINGTVRLIPRESGIKIWGAQGKQYYEIKGTFTYCV